MRTYLLFTFLLVFGQVCFAQQPTYIPPTPQAATFLKYRDYPVDLSTGLVDISIPLMNLKLKSYDLPIAAQFHASGHKVDMSYSELGNNWRIAGYGMITREVRGLSDEYYYFDNQLSISKENYYELQYSETDMSTREEKWRRRSSLDGSNGFPKQDSEYDIYTISFNGISSSFTFVEPGKAVFLDYFPYKIQKQANDRFLLTDEKGIEYIFGNVVENGNTYGATITSNNSQQVGNLNWYIAKVSTPDKDVIRFRYNTVTSDGFYLGGNPLYGARATLGDYATRYSHSYVDYMAKHSGALQFSIQSTHSNEQQKIACLTSIESSIGKISFVYNANRYSLNEMIMTNNSGVQLQKIGFEYQSIVASNLTIPNNQGQTVKAIRIMDPINGQTIQRYGVEYYPQQIVAANVSEYGYGRDYWGYANTNKNFNIIPVDQVIRRTGEGGTGAVYPVGNSNLTIGNSSRRNPDYGSKLIGALKKITYPTGGSVEFTYEANLYRAWQGNPIAEQGPGLRISQIKQSDGSTSIIKHYKYGVNEDGTGILFRKPVATDFQFTQFVTDIPEVNGVMTTASGFVLDNAFRYRYREFYSDPIGHIRPAYNIPVYYSNVTEYQTDSNGNNLGKTNYTFSTPYLEVDYKDFNESGTGESFRLSKFVPHYYSKSRPSSTTIYEFANNLYKPVKLTGYRYSKKKELKLPQATYHRWHRVLSERSSGGENYEEKFVETKYPNSMYNHSNLLFPWSVIGTRYYELTAALETLDEVFETDYTTTVPITRKTLNFYESGYTNSPSMAKVSDSREGEVVTKYFYPDDVATVSSLTGGNLNTAEMQGVEAMKKSNRHFPSVPVQIEKYSKDGQLTEVDRSNFRLEAGAPLLSSKHKRYGGSGSLFKDYEILRYDSYANPTELRSRDNSPTVYLWGYGGQYPIAKIQNASYAEVLGILGQAAITNIEALNVSESTINTHIQTLRTSLKKAQVTTYTYSPLTGMKSMTDPRGQTEHYEYDGFQRLKEVLDFDRNVLTDYQYHYKP